MASQRLTVTKMTTRQVLIGSKVYEVPARPYCDCPRPAHGFVKRDDDVWVRPCCMRVTEHVFNAHGERPSTGLKDCPGCGSNNHKSTAPWRKEAS